MTKRKIEERLKEHIRDLKNYNQTTALTRTNIETPIKMNTMSIEKIANYDGLHNALIREAIEIIELKHENEEKICNEITHATIDNRWRQIINEKQGKRREKEKSRQKHKIFFHLN